MKSNRQTNPRKLLSQAGRPDVQKPDVRSRVYYERHLPHEIPAGFPLFLSWNLKGSLPQSVLDWLERESERLEKQPPRLGESRRERSIRQTKCLFVKRDRYLDSASTGPLWLKDPQAAEVVVESFLWGVPSRYILYAWVVMANHVHALFTPLVDLEIITQGIKGFTSYSINTLQEQRGREFWQDESFDHWARDEEEMLRIIAYIENNPVAAGICRRPADYQWSSAAWRERLGWKTGEPFQPQWKSTLGFPA